MSKEVLEDAIVHQAIASILDEYKNGWQNIQPMVETKKKLDEFIVQSVKLRTQAGVKSSGVTMSKNSIKTDMLKDADILHSALTAYANLSQLDDLKFNVESLGKQLKKGRREMQAYDNCLAVFNLATNYKTALLEYDITQAKLDHAETMLKKFIETVHLPKILIKSNKVVHHDLLENKKEIDLLLKNQLDKLINVIATEQPELADKYFALRNHNKTRGKNKKTTPIL